MFLVVWKQANHFGGTLRINQYRGLLWLPHFPSCNGLTSILPPPSFAHPPKNLSFLYPVKSTQMCYLQLFLHTSNFNRSAYTTFLNTIFVFASWPVKHNLVSWQYRRFNLWYCCHQIMRRASLQHHYISESCLHSWEKLNFCTFWNFLCFCHCLDASLAFCVMC